MTDCPGEGKTVLVEKLTAIRIDLTELEVARYEWLGKACNWAVTSAARQYEPLDSASDLAGTVYAGLTTLGVKSLQLNVYADQQVYEATATPPAGPILEQARIELEAERWGLRLQLARTLTVKPPQGDLVASYEGCGNLLASASGAATAGSTLGALFDALSHEYEALGYQEALAFISAGGITGAGETPLLELVAPDNQVTLAPTRALVLETQLGGASLRETFLLTETSLIPITLGRRLLADKAGLQTRSHAPGRRFVPGYRQPVNWHANCISDLHARYGGPRWKPPRIHPGPSPGCSADCLPGYARLIRKPLKRPLPGRLNSQLAATRSKKPLAR